MNNAETEKTTSEKFTVCPGCTLLCDDIEVSKNNGQGVSQMVGQMVCQKGQDYFEIESFLDRQHTVDGKPVSREKAISAAVEILAGAKAPLVCGLEKLSTSAQQHAWKLAERIGANLDTAINNGGRASMFALQRRGKVTATLGEIAQRSDLVVFWFCDPFETHPRLMERLNKFTGTSREFIVVHESTVDLKDSECWNIQLDRENAPAFLATLRALIMGLDIGDVDPNLADLAARLSNAKYGTIFHGQVSSDSEFDLAADSLNCLISELNDKTRFVGMKLRKDFNGQSAENVMAWTSGYPFAINLAQKFPRFNQLEFSAETVLQRGECDAILFATGVDIKTAFENLSMTAKSHLASIPKIALSPIPKFQSDVCFQVGIPGIDQGGEFCRNDDVSIPIRIGKSCCPESSVEILKELTNQIVARTKNLRGIE